MEKTEKQFENQIKRWLNSQGIYRLGGKVEGESNGYYIKRWGGGRYTPAGLPDLQIVIGTYCLEVELKQEKGRISAIQTEKIAQINKSGGHALILKPSGFEYFKSLIEHLIIRKQECQNIRSLRMIAADRITSPGADSRKILINEGIIQACDTILAHMQQAKSEEGGC